MNLGALKTHSQFFYGQTVTADNCFIDFTESAVAKTAEIAIGSYTLTDYLTAVALAMNNVLTATASVSINRTTGIVTLTFSSAVTLLGLSGPNSGQSALSLLGITATDYSAVTSVVGASRAGSMWRPQFPAQDYIPSSLSVRAASASVSKSASGRVSVQSFGQEKFIKANFQYITNIPQEPGFVCETDSQGVESATAFLEYAITKAPMEFMADRNDPATFESVLLESTPFDPNGVGFELKEYYDKGLPYYFETGRLTFRVIED